jgi:DNA-binding CsgD family transcriptional regulator
MTVFPRRADESGLTLRAAVPMVGVGPELDIVLWNEAAQALLGFGADEVMGRPCFEVLACPGATRRLHCSGSGRPGACAGPCVPPFETELCARSGARMPVSVTTLVAASGDGAPVRLHFLRETTRERQLEELLRHVVSTASKLSPAPPAAQDGSAARDASLRGVTAREREVVKLLAQGSSTDDIAARLGVTPRTARNHIQNVLGKLRVHSRLEAVVYASARGLL